MRCVWILFAGLLAITGGGCSVSGGGLTLFPEGHKMLESTEAVTQRASPLPLPRELAKEPLPTYVVEPGDVLLVEITSEQDPIFLPGDQTVIQDGTIDLGVYGRHVVAGKTLAQIEAQLAAAFRQLKKDVDTVSVRVIDRPSKVFYVLGEVVSPGAYPLDGRETVLDGILTAGGLSDRAQKKKIILSRPTEPAGCRVVLPVCYDEIVQLGDTSTNYQLAPGDRIFVATRGLFDFLHREQCPPCGQPHYPCAIPDEACPAPLALPDAPQGFPVESWHDAR